MNDRQPGPLGVFGGTFDPVHIAHVALAAAAHDQLGLDGVLWIPAGKPPHRGTPHVSAEHRLAMAACAIEGDSRFTLDASEVESSSPSYTVDTLERLRQRYGAQPLVLLLGADAFLGLARWHRWQQLFDLAHIAVATRPGYIIDAMQMEDATLQKQYGTRHTADKAALRREPAGRIVTFPIPSLEISASDIREKLAAGTLPRGLLPGKVLDYIAANHLYSF